jgi:hypothetical protein
MRGHQHATRGHQHAMREVISMPRGAISKGPSACNEGGHQHATRGHQQGAINGPIDGALA